MIFKKIQLPKDLADKFAESSSSQQMWLLFQYDLDYDLYIESQEEDTLHSSFKQLITESFKSINTREVVWYKRIFLYPIFFGLTIFLYGFSLWVRFKMKTFEKRYPEELL